MLPPALLAAAEGDALYPGPGPWDARAWVGAAVYAALFLAALWGIWALVRTDACAGGEERP